MEIVAHAARIDKNSSPNTLTGIKECIARGIKYIEIDIAPLASGDFIIFHNEKLDDVTNTKGDVFSLDREVVNNIRYLKTVDRRESQVSQLTEIVDFVKLNDEIEELQLDMKVYPTSLLNERIVEKLIDTVSSVRKRIRITSCAEWVLFKLREFDKNLKLGFDPQFYLDFRKGKSSYPPFRKNRFGYYDEHPIAFQNWALVSDYLEARAESLWNVGSTAEMWYIRYEFLIRSMEDGFDWVSFLHKKGAEVCAWTVDVTKNSAAEKVKQLRELGVDRVTSNTPILLRKYL